MNEAFSDRVASLKRLLMLRMQAHFGTDNSKINANIQSFVLKLDVLQASIGCSKAMTRSALQDFPNKMPLMFFATKTENKETIALQREDFKTQWAQLRSDLDVWLK